MTAPSIAVSETTGEQQQRQRPHHGGRRERGDEDEQGDESGHGHLAGDGRAPTLPVGPRAQALRGRRRPAGGRRGGPASAPSTRRAGVRSAALDARGQGVERGAMCARAGPARSRGAVPRHHERPVAREREQRLAGQRRPGRGRRADPGGARPAYDVRAAARRRRARRRPGPPPLAGPQPQVLARAPRPGRQVDRRPRCARPRPAASVATRTPASGSIRSTCSRNCGPSCHQWPNSSVSQRPRRDRRLPRRGSARSGSRSRTAPTKVAASRRTAAAAAAGRTALVAASPGSVTRDGRRPDRCRSRGSRGSPRPPGKPDRDDQTRSVSARSRPNATTSLPPTARPVGACRRPRAAVGSSTTKWLTPASA